MDTDTTQENLNKALVGFQIPAKPELLFQLQTLMEDGNPSLQEISDIIMEDVGLSSAILRTINSPYYGIKQNISSIHQATILIGMEAIKALSTIALLRTTFKNDGNISLERFWDNATDIAHTMSFINKRVTTGVSTELVYSLGLFHDCGIPAMSLKFKDYRNVLITANKLPEQSIIDVEDQYYDTNHAIVGYYIAKTWHLSPEICKTIFNHHDRYFLADCEDKTIRLLYSLLKTSEHLVDRYVRFQENADWLYVKQDVLAALGMSDFDLGDLEDDYSNTFKETCSLLKQA